jgi:hypothetical protein
VVNERTLLPGATQSPPSLGIPILLLYLIIIISQMLFFKKSIICHKLSLKTFTLVQNYEVSANSTKIFQFSKKFKFVKIVSFCKASLPKTIESLWNHNRLQLPPSCFDVHEYVNRMNLDSMRSIWLVYLYCLVAENQPHIRENSTLH